MKYKIIQFHSDDFVEFVENRLNRAAEEGWEVIQVVPRERGTYHLIMEKKEK